MLRPLINYIAEDGKFKDNKGDIRKGWRGRMKGDRRRRRHSAILP